MTVVPVTMLALWLPAEDYRTYWRTFRFVDWSVVTLSLTALGGYLAGLAGASQLASSGPSSAGPASATGRFLPVLFETYEHRLMLWCRLTLGLTVTGYAVWFGAAWQRGLSWTELSAVVTRRENAIYALKDYYFQTIPGITTLTQFGMAFMTLAALLGLGGAWRRVRWSMTLVLILGLLRAYIVSERLAVIELILPPLVLIAFQHTGRWKAKSQLHRMLINAAPALAPVALVLFFASAEFFRSWIAVAGATDRTLLEFSALRLAGYYVTALNNSIYVLRVCEASNLFPGLTLDWLYRFPLIGPALGMEGDLRALERDGNFSILQNGANPEFTNTGGLLAPLIDYGLIGGFLFWLAVGFAVGHTWNSLKRSQLTGLLLYPMMFIGLLEVVRIPYLFLGRSAPSLALLGLTAFLYSDSWSKRRRRLGRLEKTGQLELPRAS